MNLRELRKNRGMTQAEAGTLIGTDKQSFYRLEKNWPNIENRYRSLIASAFGVFIMTDDKGDVTILPKERNVKLKDGNYKCGVSWYPALDYILEVHSETELADLTEKQFLALMNEALKAVVFS